jgi:hypothetical protein
MQIIIIILLIVFGYASKLNAETAQPVKPIQTMPSITWKQYRLIEIAMTEVRKRNSNVEEYSISVSELENSYTVVFFDPNPPPPPLPPSPPKKSKKAMVAIPWGDAGGLPTFQIEIRKTDLQVIKLVFAR